MGAAASASSLGDGEKLAIFDAIAASPEALAAVAKLLPASLPEAVAPPPPASPRPAAAPAAADPGDASEESDEDDDGSDASSAGASSAPGAADAAVSALWSIAGNVPRRARAGAAAATTAATTAARRSRSGRRSTRATSTSCAGMRELADKAETERCLARCREAGVAGLGPGAGSFFPRTWLLPEARDELFERRSGGVRAACAAPPTVIFKPAAGSEGNGIVLIQHEPAAVGVGLPRGEASGRADLVYLHREGLARFCTEPYAPPTADNLHRAYAHLTNYSLNKRSDAYVNATDVAAAADREAFAGASKRPASYVIQELDAKGLIDAPTVWAQIERLSALVAFAFQPELALRYRSTFPAAAKETLGAAAAPRGDDGEPGDDARRAFHVLGLDVMLDKRGVPRLIEVNSNPSLAIDQEVEVDGETPEKGMGSGQWVRFCRDAGLLDLPGNILKADLEIMHAKLARPALEPGPARPAMRHSTFASALARRKAFRRAVDGRQT
ncbi:hypothetical protein JL722_8801 [Aureococcus anophagefferens]|nr:hypothetical protein JL722_8801 [Aureococcus anophagefferens]